MDSTSIVHIVQGVAEAAALGVGVIIFGLAAFGLVVLYGYIREMP